MLKKVRRVVVGQNDKDRSTILQDSAATDIDCYLTGVDEAVSINLWASQQSPAQLDAEVDPTTSGLPFLPSKQGTIFRVCDIAPNSYFMYRLDELFINGEKITEQQKSSKHPLMHKVDALCYGIVLEGEVNLILDDSETVLKPGDTVVDCGSAHAWSNKTDKICRMAFVLIDAVR